MRVREARPGDEAPIRTVHERSVRQLAAAAYPDEVIEAWTSLSEDDDADAEAADDPAEDAGGIQPGDGVLFVAEVADADDEPTVAGFGDVRFDPPEYLEEPTDGGVRAVYVDPDHAGEGVGSALLERLERTARDRELDSLGLHSSVNARGFYEEHGDELVTELIFEFGGEVEGPAVELRKDL